LSLLAKCSLCSFQVVNLFRVCLIALTCKLLGENCTRSTVPKTTVWTEGFIEWCQFDNYVDIKGPEAVHCGPETTSRWSMSCKYRVSKNDLLEAVASVSVLDMKVSKIIR